MRNRYYVQATLIILLLLQAFAVSAKVKLPSVIGSNMVLQQQSQAKLWGWAKGSAQISINTSWDNKIYKVKADAAGNWLVKVATPVAGGPYEISFNDGDLVTLNNILIGEVWVCSGQSNMEMPLRGNFFAHPQRK